MQYLGDLFYHPFTLRAYTATEKSGHARIMDVHLFIALLEDEGAAGKLLAEQGTDTEKMLRQEYYLAK
jgi:Clp amino terminal domain, pathogenicity island component